MLCCSNACVRGGSGANGADDHVNSQHDVEILLVEDDPNDAALTLRAFQARNLTNQVFVARDGAEALDFFFGDGSHPWHEIGIAPRGILLDLDLPKVGGLEVLRRLKADRSEERRVGKECRS